MLPHSLHLDLPAFSTFVRIAVKASTGSKINWAALNLKPDDVITWKDAAFQYVAFKWSALNAVGLIPPFEDGDAGFMISKVWVVDLPAVPQSFFCDWAYAGKLLTVLRDPRVAIYLELPPAQDLVDLADAANFAATYLKN